MPDGGVPWPIVHDAMRAQRRCVRFGRKATLYFRRCGAHAERFRTGQLVTSSLVWDDVHVRQYDNAAVVIGRHTQQATHRGQSSDGQFRAPHVVVKADGQWRLASIQLSPIDHIPSANGWLTWEARRLQFSSGRWGFRTGCCRRLRLPLSDVATALKNLERSEVLRDAFGGPLIDAFVAVHRHEVETCADRPTAKIAEELWWRK